MHGAGQWIALGMLLGGGTVVFPDIVTQLDPASILDAIERERVDFLAIVGEAFARPLCEELERAPPRHELARRDRERRGRHERGHQDPAAHPSPLDDSSSTRAGRLRPVRS